MNIVHHRCAQIALPFVVLAVLGVGTGVVTGASGKVRATCDNSAVKTLLENGTVRIYKAHGKFYACDRSNGRAYRIGAPPPKLSTAGLIISDFQVAGAFVGWYESWEQDLQQAPNAFDVLNVKTGARRSVAAGTYGQGTSVDTEYVMNSIGTIVYLQAAQSCLGSHCSFTNTVEENSAQAQTTLDSESDAQAPVGQLGISQSGKFAYWLGSDSQPHFARIS